MAKALKNCQKLLASARNRTAKSLARGFDIMENYDILVATRALVRPAKKKKVAHFF